MDGGVRTGRGRVQAVRMPAFINAPIYRLPVARPPHPLATIRAPHAEDLAVAMGWLDRDDVVEAEMADRAALERFHDPDYLDALQRAETEQGLPEALRARYRIGADANPLHPAVFRRPATSAGAAMLAARLTLEGGIAHAPAAGNHHARRDRASGFCYLNDAVLGLLAWRDAGVGRIVYLDLDAHHGDGVEVAFADDPSVLTISVHEAGRWPRTGMESDPIRGILNFPVPPGFDDRDFAILLHAAILPAVAGHRPEAVMLLPGADALAGDPMSKLALSNRSLFAAVDAVRDLAPRLVVLGGGGYNPYLVARAWAGIWARLNDLPIPVTLPGPALDVLREIRYFRAIGRSPPGSWLTTIADPASGEETS